MRGRTPYARFWKGCVFGGCILMGFLRCVEEAPSAALCKVAFWAECFWQGQEYTDATLRDAILKAPQKSMLILSRCPLSYGRGPSPCPATSFSAPFHLACQLSRALSLCSPVFSFLALRIPPELVPLTRHSCGGRGGWVTAFLTAYRLFVDRLVSRDCIMCSYRPIFGRRLRHPVARLPFAPPY